MPNYNTPDNRGNQNNRYAQSTQGRQSGNGQYSQPVQSNRPVQASRPQQRNTVPGVRPINGQNGPARRRPKKKKRPSAGAVIGVLILAVALIICVCAFSCNSNGGDTVETTEPIETTAPDTTSEDTTAPDTTEPPVTEPPVPEVTFKADLSEYEKYFEPENREEYTILINTSRPLDETYKPDDLIPVVDTRKDGRATQYLREYASKALEAMLIEARANGCVGVSVTSAYRSFEYQTQLFNNEVATYSSYMSYDDAYKKAATYVAIPGTSEHQSGLCADIHNISTGASVTFANTPEGKWLAENCWKFGFILRFPEDKTEITGITFEPWHFRYVGRYTAYQIHSRGICFEEYYDLVEQGEIQP